MTNVILLAGFAASWAEKIVTAQDGPGLPLTAYRFIAYRLTTRPIVAR